MVESTEATVKGVDRSSGRALSLSCLTQRPFRIYNIQERPEEAGLMPQHLTSIRLHSSSQGQRWKVTGRISGTDLFSKETHRREFLL